MDMNNPNMGDILKEAEKVQAKIESIRIAISSKVFIGVAGGGLVKVHMRGDFTIINVEIEGSLLADSAALGRDLGALLAAAINDAKDQLNEESANSLKPLMKELGLPEDFEFPMQ